MTEVDKTPMPMRSMRNAKNNFGLPPDQKGFLLANRVIEINITKVGVGSEQTQALR